MKTAKKKRTAALSQKSKRGFLGNLVYYKEYYIMLIPGLLFFLVFCYGPMYGLVIAFQDYYPLKGVSQSEWVGFKHFQKLFTDPFFLSVLKNTLIISFYKLCKSVAIHKWHLQISDNTVYIKRYFSCLGI
mgnify:CR=1 FL=1